MKKKLGLFIFLLFIIPISVFAEEKFTVSLDGTSTAATIEKIDFTISLNSPQEATVFETTLKYDTDILELISIAKEESWSGDNELKSTGTNALKFTNNGIKGESSVVTLKFRVKSSSKSSTIISLEDIKLTVNPESEDEERSILTHQTLTKDVTIKSDDSSIKNIKIDGKTINGFSSKIYDYVIEVDSITEYVKVSATLNDEKTSKFVENYGNREVELEYGENKVLLKVESESGKTSTYTIKIVRKDDRVANTDLKSIIINGGKNKINFDKSILKYNVKTYKLETIEIEAEADDSTSTVKIDAPKKLVIGENKVKITVTAVTNDTKEYILIITNSEVPTDTRLKNLSVKGLNIGFNSDKYKYSIRYDKAYKKGLTIYNTTLSEDTEVTITGNTNLKEGSVIKILVTAVDGSDTSEYTITLEKDSRINFFLILDIVVGIILIILIAIQLKKRNKIKKQKENLKKEEELEKTKEIKL